MSRNPESTPNKRKDNSKPTHLTLFERMVQLFEREAEVQRRKTRNMRLESEDFMEYHNPTLSIKGYNKE